METEPGERDMRRREVRVGEVVESGDGAGLKVGRQTRGSKKGPEWAAVQDILVTGRIASR